VEQGNIVQLHRTVLRSGAEKTLITLAFVLGVITEPGYASEDGSPALNVAYLDPDRANLIGSTDWRNAFDRESAVKHQSHEHVANESERVFYSTLDELTAGDHALVELGQISEFVRKAFPDATGENVAEIVISLLDKDKEESHGDPREETPNPLPVDDRIFYGPHNCGGCDNLIVKAAVEQGGAEYDAPEGPIYPNTPWKLHVCSGVKSAPVAADKTETIPSMPAVELTEGVVPELVKVESAEGSTEGTDSPNQASEAAGV
jgi:hypothetical protein